MSDRQFPSLSSRRRLLAISAVMLLAVPGVVFFRLQDLQFSQAETLVKRGEDQRFQTRELPARRGDIYDSQGSLLATSLIRYTIWADPRRVKNASDTAERLAEPLEMEASEVLSRLTTAGAFSYLKRKATEDVEQKVAELDLPGIHSYKEYARHYPTRRTVRGSFVGFVGNEEQGLGGIEFAYDDQLIGTPGRIYLEGDPRGNPIATGVRREQPATPGASVHLSVDAPFQYQTEQILLSHTAETGSLSGTAIVMEPSTGETLSMATVLQSEENGEKIYEISQENRAVTWTFEPGSAMKALTFAAVLDSGVGEPETVKEVSASMRIYDADFSDHDWHPTLYIDITEIVRISSNIGTILWAREMGNEAFYRYLRSFGLASELLGGALPGESPGQLLNEDDWSGTSAATIALGQGVALTPLQMLNVYNVIANEGVYVPPKVVTEVVSAAGLDITPDAEPSRVVISPETAAEMTEILTTVVRDGTGKNAAVPHYRVAGKTGTARKPLPTGGYEDEDGNYRYITAFAGFLPAENPAISLIVVLEEPQNSIYASQTSAPAFAELAQEAVRHFHIPPSEAAAQQG